jgi:hypothetical protein
LIGAVRSSRYRPGPSCRRADRCRRRDHRQASLVWLRSCRNRSIVERGPRSALRFMRRRVHLHPELNSPPMTSARLPQRQGALRPYSARKVPKQLVRQGQVLLPLRCFIDATFAMAKGGAERAYAALTTIQQEAARRLFLRLVICRSRRACGSARPAIVVSRELHALHVRGRSPAPPGSRIAP